MKRGTGEAGKSKNTSGGKKPTPAKLGRPSKFTPAVAERIISGLSKGTPLTVICAPDDMPGITTVWDWQQKDPDFSERIARAREAGFDVIAQECLDIANTPIEGIVETTKEWGVEIKRDDMLGHRRLQIDTRLKLLAKWDPKRYGDRSMHEISGPDGGAIQTMNITPDMEDRIAMIAETRAAMKPLGRES